MSNSTHQIAVKAIDQTAGAFKSVENRARLSGATIRRVLGGAFAAAGAYLSVRSVMDAVNELGDLSDKAMKAGTSVEFLTSAATAFQVAGLNIGVDQLTNAMQHLEKATGKTGEAGFYGAIEALQKIEDPVKRGAEATRLFGRSALELQPLINGGQEAVERFRVLQGLMPKVSTAAANAGDRASNAMTIAGARVKSIWLNVVGKVTELWSDYFPEGIEVGVMAVLDWIEYALKRSFNSLTRWGTKIGLFGQAIGNWAFNGYSFKEAMDELARQNIILDSDFDQKEKEIRAQYKMRSLELLQAQEKYGDGLFDPFAGNRNGATGKTSVAAGAASAAAEISKRISAQLALAGSNEARRLQILGPEYRSEQKKQTELLKQIADNTKETAVNVDSDSDLKVADIGA